MTFDSRTKIFKTVYWTCNAYIIGKTTTFNGGKGIKDNIGERRTENREHEQNLVCVCVCVWGGGGYVSQFASGEQVNSLP